MFDFFASLFGSGFLLSKYMSDPSTERCGGVAMTSSIAA